MADRDRDRHTCDSGLPTNDDSLVTIQGGTTSDSDMDSEEILHRFFHAATPTPSLAMAQPNAGQVRPQQIANILLFDGERGEGFNCELD